jgi:hypothetical protein
MRKVISFLIVLSIVILNIRCDHVTLETDTHGLSFYYYLFHDPFSLEFCNALMTFYLLLVLTMLMLFDRYHRFLFAFLVFLGIFCTFSLWGFMNFQCDKIIEFKFAYYSILIMNMLGIAACVIALIFSYKDADKASTNFLKQIEKRKNENNIYK